VNKQWIWLQMGFVPYHLAWSYLPGGTWISKEGRCFGGCPLSIGQEVLKAGCFKSHVSSS
jgi:hypothetical protein